jgi:hypothetical protein
MDLERFTVKRSDEAAKAVIRSPIVGTDFRATFAISCSERENAENAG